MSDNIQETLENVKLDFESKHIPVDAILANVKMSNVSSKESPAFTDDRYLPFYYRLGRHISPRRVCQIGSTHGLVGASFLRGCKTVEEWTVIDQVKPPVNIVMSNLKLNSDLKVTCRSLDLEPLGEETDYSRSFEVSFLSERYSRDNTDIYLEFLWGNLKPEGLLVVDYIDDQDVSQSFLGFCRVKNRTPVFFKTRYGVGIVIR